MADSIDFEASRFATYAMMPSKDEEITALWARKLAWNTGRSVGKWATAVMGSTGQYFGTFEINFATMGFNTIPDIEIWQIRGGTMPVLREKHKDVDSNIMLGMNVYVNGGSVIHINHYPDFYSQQQTAFDPAKYGTFIYRLSGW